MVKKWTRCGIPCDDRFSPRAEQGPHALRYVYTESFMIAVIGNVIAGLGVLGLFAATLRLTRSTK
jgi:hypothetical protein